MRDATAPTATRRFGAALLVCSVLLIVRATLVGSMSAGGTAASASMWCLTCSPTSGADVVLNTVLFIPLGISFALIGALPWQTMLAGLIFSAAIELSQRAGFPSGRDANGVDVATNTLGILCGALIARHRKLFLRPNVLQARTLTLVATSLVCALFIFTGWALERDPTPAVQSEMRVSQLHNGTGFGWFNGRLLAGSIGVMQAGAPDSGPLIFAGSLAATDSARVVLSGRDERAHFVPALFLHSDRSDRPVLMIGQDGHDAQLIVSMNADRFRLAKPELILAKAFEPKRFPVEVRASIRGGDYTLEAITNDFHSSNSLQTSVASGWTLFQSVVHADNRWANSISLGWLVLLCAPLAFWAKQTGAHRSYFVATVCATLAISLALVPRIFVVSETTPVQWLAVAASILIGIFISRATERVRHA